MSSSNTPPPNWQEIVQKMEDDKQRLEGQLKYTQQQLGEYSKRLMKRRGARSSIPSDQEQSKEDDEVHQERRHPPYDRPNHGSKDIKIDIPTFDGKLDPDEFIEWLTCVERVFNYQEIDHERKVKIVALKLRKYASTWWTNVCVKRKREGKEKV